MKTLIIIFLFTFIISCSDDDNSTNSTYKSSGIITGYDYRKCACCGGWLILINNNTYRFTIVPANSALILENETMPLNVLLDWRKDTTVCGDEITVERIKKK